MADFTVQFRNLGATISKLENFGQRAEQASAGELYRSAEEVMTEAKELTPVDTGNLRASGHVQLPVMNPDRVSVAMGFGGPAGSGNVGGETNKEDAGYAFVQHEDANLQHTVGQAKFLETPLLAKKAEIQKRLERAIYDEFNPSSVKKARSGGPITPSNPITDDDVPF